MIFKNCFSETGNFSPELYMAERYNAKANKLSLVFNDDECFDWNALTDELLKEKIPNLEAVYRTVFRYKGANEVDLEYAESSTGFYVVVDRGFYHLSSRAISFYSIDTIDEEKVKEIYNSLPKAEAKSKEAIVNLVAYSDGTFYTIDSKIKSVNINIEENYNDDFVPVFEDITNFINSRESGLVLLWGTPGSGKTSLIRHLCSQYPAEYIIVPTSLTPRLADPDFITFMMNNSDSVFILEDCEQILMDRDINVFNGAISNILNMSDGLLSDIMNLKFICTFNSNIQEIDQALLRKGRCYAKYEFKELCEEKVDALNTKYNLGLPEIKPMTLAEIYNSDKKSYSDRKPVRKIGF